MARQPAAPPPISAPTVRASPVVLAIRHPSPATRCIPPSLFPAFPTARWPQLTPNMRRAARPSVCALLPPPPTPVRSSAPPLSVSPVSHRRRPAASPPLASASASATAITTLSRQHAVFKFLAGGLAGSLSAFFTTPLEVLRTRMQASGAGRAGRSVAAVTRSIAAAHGLAGFYRGLGVSILGSLPSRSIYFATYAKTKALLANFVGSDSPLAHLTAAVAAGGTSNFIMSPLWVVRTRMQLGGHQYRGYVHACGKILSQEGPAGLYRGFSASLWGTSEAAIHFVLYERLKKLQLAHMEEHASSGKRAELTPFQYTATAAVSKFIASVATYPHERVRVLMREIPKAGAKPKYRFMVQSLRLIAREEGWQALYRGMGCHLARTVPNTAIMFLSYEMISKNLERRHNRKLAELKLSEMSSNE